MRILITAGPTYEPIDSVRYISNRSSGRMGMAIAEAALAAGHTVTAVLGPIAAPVPAGIERVDVETTQQMLEAVLQRFSQCDLLIMAAAVADFRPRTVHAGKLERNQSMTIELEPTPDILAAAGQIKQTGQRTVGFSLVSDQDIARSIEKLHRKRLDLIVSNPPATMNAQDVSATLFWADGRSEALSAMPKSDFARRLVQIAEQLF